MLNNDFTEEETSLTKIGSRSGLRRQLSRQVFTIKPAQHTPEPVPAKDDEADDEEAEDDEAAEEENDEENEEDEDEEGTLQPHYNTVRYNTVLDTIVFKNGSQKCIDYIDK